MPLSSTAMDHANGAEMVSRANAQPASLPSMVDPRFLPHVWLWTDQDGPSGWTGGGAFGPMLVLRGVEDLARLDSPPEGIEPGHGRWIGWCSYEFGKILELKAATPGGARQDRRWPLGIFTYVARGDAKGVGPDIGGFAIGKPGTPESGGERTRFDIGPLRSNTGREGYCEAVSRVIGLIHAGDVFQVNVTHRLSGTFRGDALAFAREMMRRASPRYGGYFELPMEDGLKRAVVSLSPELFFEFNAATGEIVTRPMKGTRPGTSDPAGLMTAAKDRAELDMIIDLMRNDLGRVCRYGSISVAARRRIESHASGGLWQAVGEVKGRVREGVGVAEILRAVFPAGSITGAPKVRAMQIIDDVEAAQRGPYCGCFGYVDGTGGAAFNVSIRTVLISGTGRADQPGIFEDAVLDYSVGAGIVAESDPESEWRETLDKASILSDHTVIVDVGSRR
ncbi:MAG: anthranilate synthase component I family protein [Phycisphaeraceae bacterium]|nr:anthranilate synthase component I family protein [Phycisphaeraceae bacterium]